MQIHDLYPFPEEQKNRKRVGRGSATGTGCTAGKGNKGQNARSGGGVSPRFEGGQMPLQRRLPKRGFKNHFKTHYHTLSLKDIFEKCGDMNVVSLDNLYEFFKLNRRQSVKILGDGEATKSLNIETHSCSQTAKKKIEAAGGSIVVLEG